jgi:hypothetical protein
LPARIIDISPLHNVETHSGTHPDSGGCFPWIKRQGSEAEVLVASSDEVKMMEL